MRATLLVIASPARPRRIQLRDGQMAQFGRSDWADFPFREDDALADVHFSVECRPTGCLLRHLAAEHQTLVNGTPAQTAVLHSGDQIAAGRTTFSVLVEGEEILPPAPDTSASVEAPADSGPKKWPADQWMELARYLDLSAPAQALIRDPQTAGEWFDALIEAKLYPEAARLLAHQLDKREAVWWNCCCIDLVAAGRMPADQQRAADAARAWVLDPSEERRREAERASERLSFGGIGGMAAAAVFWAGDNIAPAEVPSKVPPDERLTGTAVTASLTFAAYFVEANQSLQRWSQFLEIGRAVAAGTNRWPET